MNKRNFIASTLQGTYCVIDATRVEAVVPKTEALTDVIYTRIMLQSGQYIDVCSSAQLIMEQIRWACGPFGWLFRPTLEDFE